MNSRSPAKQKAKSSIPHSRKARAALEMLEGMAVTKFRQCETCGRKTVVSPFTECVRCSDGN